MDLIIGRKVMRVKLIVTLSVYMKMSFLPKKKRLSMGYFILLKGVTILAFISRSPWRSPCYDICLKMHFSQANSDL